MPNLALTSALVACAAVVPLLPAFGQGVTPTHTFETPMVFPPFDGTVVFASMIAPPSGENVVRTELHLTWITDGTQSAALFGMHGSMPLEGGPSFEWEVVGSDLGFGAPAGAWSAVVSTSLWNGTVAGALPGFPPILHLTFEAAGGGALWGVIGPGSKIVFHLGPRATADVPVLSLASGGSQTLSLSAGPTVGPGKLYVVAGSASGAAPGLDLGAVHVPLVPDSYTSLALGLAGHAPFVGFVGLLDPTGSATAALVLPGGAPAALAGLVLHHSMLLLDPATGELLSASNAVPLALVP